MHSGIEDVLGMIAAEQRAVGEQVQPPASPQAIQALSAFAREHLGAELPESYAALLSSVDGLDFNGTVLYATTERDLPGGGTLLGFREANKIFMEGGERHHLLLGETGDELFAWDRQDGAWRILDRGSLSQLETFPDGDALLERVLRRAYES